MATGKNFLTKKIHRFLPKEKDNAVSLDSMFEFDEADVWGENNNSGGGLERKKSIPISRGSKKLGKKAERNSSGDQEGGVANSLPISVPDWSKILKEEYRDTRRVVVDDDDDDDDDDDGDDEDGRFPPHEYLARQLRRSQIASFSVHEGRGRTLKGRDLSRVRDAIWAKTGFEP